MGDERWEMGGNFVTKTKIHASNQQRLSVFKLSIHQFDQRFTICIKKLALEVKPVDIYELEIA
jgi:hypothetical protein